ncbi:MAG: DUF6308 family protein [Gordonia amarae]
MKSATYDDWRKRWPAVIVQHQDEASARLLTDYYAETSGVPKYSGSQFEAVAALNSDPNSIGPADIVAISTLSVNVKGQAAIRLLTRDAADISERLELIPTDVDIVDADPGSLESGSAASELWQILRRGRDKIGPTTASKLIAAKRPRLLPIWDSLVEQATGLSTLGYWRSFQDVLTSDDHAIWKWLTDLRKEVPEVPDSVSNLRVLDILLWMSVKKGLR